MAGIKKKQSARRLRIEKMRLKGLTHAEIAKKLKVSIRTIERDVAQLDLELQSEPAYTDTRLKLRQEFNQRYADELLEIKKDLEIARAGSELVEETNRPLKKGEVKKIRDPQKLLETGMDPVQLEITKRIFGPNWSAIAQLHKVLLDCINSWAKLFGLSIERETQVTKETEKVIQEGRVIFIDKPSEEEFLQEVEQFKRGKIPQVVTLDEPKGKE